MTKIYLHEGQSGISWDASLRGMVGKKPKSGLYVSATDLHVDKNKIITITAIGLTVGIVALLVAAAAIALIFLSPMISTLALPALIGIAAGAGTIGIIGTIIGSIGADTLRVGLKFKAVNLLDSVVYV